MSEENVNPIVTESVDASQETAHVEPAQTTESQATQPSHEEEAASGILASLLALKESNANAFYGIVGGVGALLLALVMLGLGGGDEVLKKADTKSLAAGQKYSLKSPNAAAEGNEVLTVRLVSTPGAMAAFDDDENKTEECRKFPVGTNVTVLDKQESGTVVYAKVQIDEGSCSGTIGWVLGINL
ncbi:MAG: hypothetical protein RLZZ384_778 [Pseudomonadota bacterium]|jgi:hypothetical protein